MCKCSLKFGLLSAFCYNISMYDLIKNIGLGLFVNGTFALLNGDFGIMPVIITIGSICIMYMSIKLDERSKNGASNSHNSDN
ncbi:hypothetical protein [Helicobacter winghamensis]|uniref:hypothetical protein n=1 Tax=Helicobacter winghamensis TaxID=157268 RepID=UPI00351B6901